MKTRTTKRADRWDWYWTAPLAAQLVTALAVMVSVWAALIAALSRLGL